MTNLPSCSDDLEAVRVILSTLKNFSKEDQQRILRWTQEKLNLVSTSTGTQQSAVPPPPQTRQYDIHKDIKSFVEQKKPRSDVEFAVTIAYYHRFEAQESERKEEISTHDLQDAARKVVKRLERPIYTLHNAFKRGLLDKGSTRGSFKINTVGENLVAMTLPPKELQKPKLKMPRIRKPARSKKAAKRLR